MGTSLGFLLNFAGCGAKPDADIKDREQLAMTQLQEKVCDFIKEAGGSVTVEALVANCCSMPQLKRMERDGFVMIKDDRATWSGAPIMNLRIALTILAESHTREDVANGFVALPVRAYYGGGWDDGDYVEAWGIVRDYLGLPCEPTEAAH